MTKTVALSDYTSLIKLIDYRKQAFQTKKAYWHKFVSNNIFKEFFDKSFGEEELTLSRGQLLDIDKSDFPSSVFSIILWGYPKNPRGGYFEDILEHLPILKNQISYKKVLTEEEFRFLCFTLKGKGIGLSTLSKFLYFFEMQIDSYRCLILDRWVINILQSGIYNELLPLHNIKEGNKVNMYFRYIETMDAVAKKMNVSVDQLELFLFLFGKNLKLSVD